MAHGAKALNETWSHICREPEAPAISERPHIIKLQSLKCPNRSETRSKKRGASFSGRLYAECLKGESAAQGHACALLRIPLLKP
eukprot:4627372-Amphidinium_carterae.1